LRFFYFYFGLPDFFSICLSHHLDREFGRMVFFFFIDVFLKENEYFFTFYPLTLGCIKIMLRNVSWFFFYLGYLIYIWVAEFSCLAVFALCIFASFFIDLLLNFITLCCICSELNFNFFFCIYFLLGYFSLMIRPSYLTCSFKLAHDDIFLFFRVWIVRICFFFN
jgi:hypothetical protein